MSSWVEHSIRAAHFNLNVLVPMQRQMEQFVRIVYDTTADLMARYEREHECDLQRMADDGCPLL